MAWKLGGAWLGRADEAWLNFREDRTLDNLQNLIALLQETLPKPNPHVVTEELQAEDDEILGAGISYASNIVNNGVRKQFMAFARAIAGQFTDNKRTIDCLVNWQCRHPELHKDLALKVEELERKHGWCDTLHTHPVKPKPQPKGGVARDKDGKKLIPRVSVVGHIADSGYRALFLYYGGPDKEGAVTIMLNTGERDETRKAHIFHVFDMDFPPSCGDEGTFPGGDQ